MIENVNIAKTIPESDLINNQIAGRQHLEDQYGKGQMLYKDFGFSDRGKKVDKMKELQNKLVKMS